MLAWLADDGNDCMCKECEGRSRPKRMDVLSKNESVAQAVPNERDGGGEVR